MHSDTKLIAISFVLLVQSCASFTLPASLKTSSGDVLVGTTTASLSGGTFEVSNPDGLSCNGTYDALDTRPTISAPVICNDNTSGVVTVTRSADGQSGMGTAAMSDGTTANVGFGRAAAIITTPTTSNISSLVPTQISTNTRTATDNKICYVGPRGGTYTITSGGNKNYAACENNTSNTYSTQTKTVTTSHNVSRKCYVGPRGGTYTITSGGNKNYNGC